MNSQIKPQLRWAGHMLLSAIAKADVEILARMSDVMRHGLERAPSAPRSPRADQHLHRAIAPLHKHALTLFNRLKEHSCTLVVLPPMANCSAFRFGWLTFDMGVRK